MARAMVAGMVAMVAAAMAVASAAMARAASDSASAAMARAASASESAALALERAASDSVLAVALERVLAMARAGEELISQASKAHLSFLTLCEVDLFASITFKKKKKK